VIARGNAVEADVTGGKHRPSSVALLRPEAMADPGAVGRPVPFHPAAQSVPAVYRFGEVNHCPGCGRVNWWVRNRTAECAFCSTALPLEQS
jgi:hypothetical protein